jgi:hypothetical protein
MEDLIFPRYTFFKIRIGNHKKHRSATLTASVVEPKPIALETNLKCLPEMEPKLRIAAPAQSPSIYHRLEEILKKKIMVAEEIFVNCYNFNLIKPKK